MATKLVSTGVEFPDSTTQTTEGVTSVTAGSALTGGGSGGSVTINHGDTSSQVSVNNSGNTVIQDVTVDDFGHITNLNSTTIASGITELNSSFSGTGFVSLSNGLILQWGNAPFGGTSWGDTFPLTFPQNCYSLTCTAISGGQLSNSSVISSLSTSGVSGQVGQNGSAVRWIAIGD